MKYDQARRDWAAFLIARSARRLVETDPDQRIALADILIVLSELGVLARETIDAEFPAEESIDEMEGRLNWKRTLLFLDTAKLFPGIRGLLTALGELNRGRRPESLAPLIAGKGSGSRTTHRKLPHMKSAVEAGDRIAALCVKQAERDKRLKDCGTTAWSLDRYRAACNEAAPHFWIDEMACRDLSIEEAELMLSVHLKLIKSADGCTSIAN